MLASFLKQSLKVKLEAHLIKKLTNEEIRRASSSKLQNVAKEDIDVDLHDMISYELFEVREAGKGEDMELTKEEMKKVVLGLKIIMFHHINQRIFLMTLMIYNYKFKTYLEGGES